MEEENIENIKNMKLKYIITCILICVIVALGSSAITFWYISKGFENMSISKLNEVKEESNSSEKITTNQIAQNLQNFRNVIDEYYLGEINEQDLLEGSIKGYVNGLGDEYSEYMTKDEWEDFQADALGNYVGVGIYMSMGKQDNIVVLSPIKGTPAEEAGVKPGDIIAQIDDESTARNDIK